MKYAALALVLLLGTAAVGCKKNASANAEGTDSAAATAAAAPEAPAPAPPITDLAGMQTALQDWVPAGLRYKNDVLRNTGVHTNYNRYYVIEGGGEMVVEVGRYAEAARRDVTFQPFTDIEKAVKSPLANQLKKKEVADANGTPVFVIHYSNSPRQGKVELRARRAVGPIDYTYSVFCMPAPADSLDLAAFEVRAMEMMKHLLAQNVQ